MKINGQKIRKGTATAANRFIDAVAAYSEAIQAERERNEKIEEQVTALMLTYTGDRLVLVDKED